MKHRSGGGHDRRGLTTPVHKDGLMGLSLVGTMFDCHDPAALGRFWSAALGYELVAESTDFVAIAPNKDTYPGLGFVRTDGLKVTKNRLHLDLQPSEQDAEVARLIALGASRIDIGQQDVGWVVMADPEGNEFCVLATGRNGGTGD